MHTRSSKLIAVSLVRFSSQPYTAQLSRLPQTDLRGIMTRSRYRPAMKGTIIRPRKLRTVSLTRVTSQPCTSATMVVPGAEHFSILCRWTAAAARPQIA